MGNTEGSTGPTPGPVRGFFDRTCRKCKKRYGWSGTINDVPRNCPKCGVALSEKELKALQHDEEMMNELRQAMLKD